MSEPRSFTYEDYLSPFTWRYGSAEMRNLWSEAYKRRLWRRIWVAIARAQQAGGLVTAEQVADLEAHRDEIDIARANEIEKEIRHDLMAEVHVFAAKCPVGGGIIHLGATSMDVEDNADILRIRDALDLVLGRVRELLDAFATQIDLLHASPTMGFTHIQPAEPTTMGYRLARHAQDLLSDYEDLLRARNRLRGKGFKGATGTSASYTQLFGESAISAREFEAKVMAEIELEPAPVASQVYPRKQDFLVLSALAALGQTLYTFAFDLRILQSPPFGEWAEPFGKKQVGSSAMPFKRNPINSENVNSLTRLLAAMARVSWDNAAHCLLERTLDDSANRRIVLPEAFLVADEALRRVTRMVRELRVDEAAASRLLDQYGVFAATERLLMEAVKRGGDRQELHEVIREHSIAAWGIVRTGAPNPLADRLCDDPRVAKLVPAEEARTLLDATGYLGDAPERAAALAGEIRAALARHESGEGEG